MKEKSINKSIESKIEKSCAILIKKFEKEKDELKKSKIQYQIAEKSLYTFLTEVKKLTNKQWEKFTEERVSPIVEQSQSIVEKFDTIVMKKSKDSKEYEKYQKLKKIHSDGTQKIFDIFNKIELNKKQLERLLALQLIVHFQTQNAITQNNLDYYEFIEAGGIVQRRLGFDYNWMTCISLIQLHENLIKKRIEELGGEIKDDDSIRILISKLSKRIEEKENRKVSVALLLSNGIKSVRDTMTHEGYKHSVSKGDLENILEEIQKLERVLYPETK